MSHEQDIKKEGKFEYLEKGEGHTILVLHGLFGVVVDVAVQFQHCVSAAC